jgi:hypothetical protein
MILKARSHDAGWPVRRSRRMVLIELLCVFAVIIVLAAMLIPGLFKGLTTSRLARWTTFKERLRTDSDLVVYYDFQNQGWTVDGVAKLRNKATATEGVNAYMPENYDGLLKNGPSWSSGRWERGKYALFFDGVNDYVDCGKDSFLDIADAITVIAWVYHVSGDGHMVNRGGGWTDYGYSLFWLSNSIRVELQRAGEKTMSDCPAPTNNEWHCIGFTWELSRATIRTYIDGVRQSNTPDRFVGPIGLPSQSLNLGRNEKQANYFYGFIDEVAVFDRCLSDTEMRNFYMMGKP